MGGRSVRRPRRHGTARRHQRRDSAQRCRGGGAKKAETWGLDRIDFVRIRLGTEALLNSVKHGGSDCTSQPHLVKT